jgi:hypothetical protein
MNIIFDCGASQSRTGAAAKKVRLILLKTLKKQSFNNSKSGILKEENNYSDLIRICTPPS